MNNNWYAQEVKAGRYGETMHGFSNDGPHAGRHSQPAARNLGGGPRLRRRRLRDPVRVLRWVDEEKDGVYFAPWTPYQHPELGEVEIRRLPGPSPGIDDRLEFESEIHYQYLMEIAGRSPLLRIIELDAEEVSPGEHRVTAVLQNEGYLSTYVTRKALAIPLDYPILAEIPGAGRRGERPGQGGRRSHPGQVGLYPPVGIRRRRIPKDHLLDGPRRGTHGSHGGCVGEARRPAPAHHRHRLDGRRRVPLRNQLAAAALTVAAASWALAQQEPPALIPDPDTGAMEAQVREKIAREWRLVESAPESAEAWGSLGRTFHAHGLEAEADEAYARAEELDPADFRWPYLRAAALKNIRPDDALQAADHASRLNLDFAPVHLLAAELMERSGHPEQSLNRYRRALEVAPGSALAELGIGRLLVRRGELDRAREHLERAAALAPRAGPVQAELARLYTRQGDAEAARQAGAAARQLPDLVPVEDPVLTKVWDESVSARGYQDRALRAEAAGAFDEAEALYERLLALRPGEPDILYNFGNLYVRTRRFEQAARRYEEAIEARPEHVAARVNLGSALLMLGRRDEAIAQLLLALEHDPADADAHRTLGGLFAYRGENEAAIRHYGAVLETDPQDAEVHRDLAIVLAAEGEFAAAWTHVDAAERLGAPPSADFLLRLRAALPRPG